MTAVTTFAAFVRRDWIIARSYRANFLMTLFSSGFFLVLLYYVGKLIDRAGRAGSELAHGYFPYVVVGIALLQIVQAALGSSATRIRDAQTTGTLEAVVASPASIPTIALAGSVYDVVQATAMWVLMMGCAVLLGLDLQTGPDVLAGSLVALLALIVLFTSLSVAVGSFIVVFKQGGVLTRLVGNALGLLGGVYFPISLLPGPVQAIARILPFTWGVQVLRTCLLEGEVDAARLAALIGSAVIALPVALWLFRAAIDRSRLRGSLAQF
jgi:ABC-2 type transport system permease protein